MANPTNRRARPSRPRARVAARAAAAPVVLVCRGTVKALLNVRASSDQRHRVDRYIVSYYGPDGEEYRKSFESQRGTMPTIPDRGTHAELNALAIQWR